MTSTLPKPAGALLVLTRVIPIPGTCRASPARSAHHKARGGRGLQPPVVASIRDGSAAHPLAGSRGAASSPTCCLQHNSRSILRFVGNGGA